MTNEHETNACVADWATACGSEPFPHIDDDIAGELATDHNKGRWEVVNIEGDLDIKTARELLKQARASETPCELCNLKTGEVIRFATYAEHALSVEAATKDGGVGAIDVDGTTCYVER